VTFIPCVPRLLVSVRDASEAVCAIEGGADVVDFKEPERGPLGRADVDVMFAAIETMDRQRGRVRRGGEVPPQSALPAKDAERTGAGSLDVQARVPDEVALNRPLVLSAAMGEVTAVKGPLPQRLPGSIRYLKLGLSGLRHSADWVGEWLRARSVIEQQAAGVVEWVAVAYADAEAAGAPPVDEVVQAAAVTGCAGVLIDTFEKSGGRLLEHLNAPSLGDLARRAQSRQMFFAVAGRLQVGDLSALRDVSPDIIAVRSAACCGENRHAPVAAAQVTALRRAIRHVFDPECAVG
jgi:(5-formylfuran-3-yl)methyl phosphate synthase